MSKQYLELCFHDNDFSYSFMEALEKIFNWAKEKKSRS